MERSGLSERAGAGWRGTGWIVGDGRGRVGGARIVGEGRDGEERSVGEERMGWGWEGGG